MRYLSLDEAMRIAENVTGIDADTLARILRIELLDSALHTPSSGFGDDEFYPDFFSKAAILGIRIASGLVKVDEFAEWLRVRATPIR